MPGIIASRDYHPCDLIYTEEPFAQILPRKLKDVVCESCGENTFALKACKQCLSVKYCGRACQKKDWSSHRLECPYLKNLPEGSCADTVRLLGKIILKIKDKYWKNIKRRILGTDFTFDDIDSHYKEMTEKPRLNLRYKELRVLMRSYIGKKNMPSDVDLIKIIGKVTFNTCLVSSTSICFFIGVSLFERECIPNSNVIQSGTVLKIWANKKITKGIDNVTIPSRLLISNTRIFDGIEDCPCKCTDCSLPYGDSVLSKIIDEEKAYSVIEETENILKLASVLMAFDKESMLSEVAEELLCKQEGVLGNTNSLRLRLLAFRYLTIGGRPFEILRPLLELEKYTRSVFGDYSLEMKEIYHVLTLANGRLFNPIETLSYLGKSERLECHE